MICLGSVGLAGAARAGLAGDTVQVYEYFPTFGDLFGSAGPATAPVTFPDVGKSLIDITVDDTSVVFDPAASYTPLAASFNGFDVKAGNTTPIIGAALDAASAPFPAGNISFDHHDLIVNFAGVPLTMSNPVIVDLTFGAGVPEPAAWVTMLLGLGCVGAGLRTGRRRPITP
jgi:hypothetical protein